MKTFLYIVGTGAFLPFVLLLAALTHEWVYDAFRGSQYSRNIIFDALPLTVAGVILCATIGVMLYIYLKFINPKEPNMSIWNALIYTIAVQPVSYFAAFIISTALYGYDPQSNFFGAEIAVSIQLIPMIIISILMGAVMWVRGAKKTAPDYSDNDV